MTRLLWAVPLLVLALAALAALDVCVLNRRGRIRPDPRHDYEIIVGHWLPKLLRTGAVTIGKRVLVRWPLIPSALGLAHEYYHVLHTRWWWYVLSPRYREREEAGANRFAAGNYRAFESDQRMVEAYLRAKGAE